MQYLKHVYNTNLCNISYGSGLKEIVQQLNLRIFIINLRNNVPFMVIYPVRIWSGYVNYYQKITFLHLWYPFPQFKNQSSFTCKKMYLVQ